MKKISFLISLVFLMISCSMMFTVSAAENDKGFKVYPFDSFIVGSGHLDMTPNGAYTITKGKGTDNYAMFNFYVINDPTVLDYEKLDHLYIYNGDTNTDFEVYAEFYNFGLGGYNYPETLLYKSSSSTKANSEIKINYKEKLNAAGKWKPKGNILLLSIKVLHGGNAGKKVNFKSIWLGGSKINTKENDSVTTGVFDFMNAEYIGNNDLAEFKGQYPGAFMLTKPNLKQSEGYAVKDLEPGPRNNTPYMYINVCGVAPDTWPYIFFKDPDNIITGEDPILIRIRPEMGDSNFWMRIDLRLARNGAEILASPNLVLRCHISIYSMAKATLDPVKFGGIYYGGEVFKLGSGQAGGNTTQPQSDKTTQKPTQKPAQNPGDKPAQNTEDKSTETTDITDTTEETDLTGDESTVTTTPTDKAQGPSEDSGFSWWYIVIPVVIVAAGAAGFVVFWLNKKKKADSNN